MKTPHAPRIRPATARLWLLAALFSLPLWLPAGCALAQDPTVEPGVDSWSIAIRENGFYPSRWRVNSNALVTVELTNQASFDADWVVMERPPELPYDAGDEANVWFRQALPAGEATTFTFQAPAMPGEYVVVCSYPGRWEQGLMGKLIVALPE
ncbi:MAG: hypothetical protein HPY76_12450 [Anaerolineae bacterium]|nr:hypothetical protein [Anaerolineae bacterium]